MQLTKKWVEKRIEEYRNMLSSLGVAERDRSIYGIWSAQLFTLLAVLDVINLESLAKVA